MFCTSLWTQSSNDGKLAILVFTVTLFAFVVESQLTQYVQTTLNYRHPFLLFWIVHSSFIVSLPCHLLYLTITTSHSFSALWKGLVFANAQHLNGIDSRSSISSTRFPVSKFIYLMLTLTAAITMPALLWFAAIEMASILLSFAQMPFFEVSRMSLATIWNTNAFFAYVFSVKVFGLKWEARKLGAVLLATFGVLAVVYGGSTVSSPSDEASSNSTTFLDPTGPLVGDILTVIASVGYAGYQVYYKKYVSLPSVPEFSEDYRPLSASEDIESDMAPHATTYLIGSEQFISDDTVYPPPFGLYSNFWTSAIGSCTFAVLWIPLPILHWLGIETFTLPGSFSTVAAIAGIALTGSMFNAGFMITLALWGPIITSVGGLLTIVLVFFSDIILGATESLTIWGVAGSATIVVAFGVLAYDMFQQG
ncbi:hypothetical protein J3R30DRAFT_3655365 [Lentinula aciculospora]|uniref:EamA domain-containing protein n=1 Tax=Lentinula aciculospora TaxID=153920 RepID=A0A9W9ANP0_9AGAR|nr:hypothetical protein J3R30DRAFT_3655365 [Lentinula aciculospora]